MNTRSIVLENVISVLENKKPLHLVLKASLKDVSDGRDRSFVARLTRGCVERMLALDHSIDFLSSVKVNKQKPVIRNILRCGLYQILFMDSVTDFAACDESVKLAVRKGFGSLRGFVNGVLRNACRRKNDLLKDIIGADSELTIRYSMPEWIVSDFLHRFGKEKTEAVFDYFYRENPLSLRCNCSRTSPEDAFQQLEKEGAVYGFNVSRNRYLDDCFSVKSGDSSLTDAPGQFSLAFFNNNPGTFVIQDFSSVLVGYAADKACLKKGIGKGKVLDICAAPGGKSMHIADMGYEVIACDISENKTKLISEAAERCGFKNVSVMENDAAIFNELFENAFDVVICDLPCSGLGIIGKKPDIKYNMTPEKIAELAGLQKQILKNAVRYLKKNGILVYSTCTLSRCENEENAGYLINDLGMRGIPVADLLPSGIEPENKDDCYIQILPGEYESDGFFICVTGRA